MITPEKLERIKEYSTNMMNGLDEYHNMEHVLITLNLAEFIAKKEKANFEVIKVAALLHDIGRAQQDKDHEQISEKMARSFLSEMGLPADFINQVSHAILCHMSRTVKNAKTIEAKVLYDADKLQAFGVYGFCRTFAEDIKFKKYRVDDAIAKAEDYEESRYKMLQTQTGKKLALAGHKIMVDFFKEYELIDKLGKGTD